ncbi:hypothetical protein F6P88_09750, partial [Streptococcus suis]|nr:hypothetical protein [Streptococcus suis]MBS8114647.1 hypothetical protein [Streptococcus suis]
WLLFIIGHMGLFVYTQKGSIISTVVLPTTEIIEPRKDVSIGSHLLFVIVQRKTGKGPVSLSY